MRKNCRATLAAWLLAEANRHAESIWTDGRRIMSYNTLLAEMHPTEEGTVVLNRTKYSPTTTTHQHALAWKLAEVLNVVYAYNVPIGTQYDLYRHIPTTTEG